MTRKEFESVAVVVAYLRNRAHGPNDEENTAIWSIGDELLQGEHLEAFKHGEIDDLYEDILTLNEYRFRLKVVE